MFHTYGVYSDYGQHFFLRKCISMAKLPVKFLSLSKSLSISRARVLCKCRYTTFLKGTLWLWNRVRFGLNVFLPSITGYFARLQPKVIPTLKCLSDLHVDFKWACSTQLALIWIIKQPPTTPLLPFSLVARQVYIRNNWLWC